MEGFFSLRGDALEESGKHELSLDLGSIGRDHPRRLAALKGPDHFDVANFPTAEFRFFEASPVAENQYRLKGTLSLHGRQKPVKLTASLRSGEVGAKVLRGDLLPSRSEFGMNAETILDEPIRDELIFEFELVLKPRRRDQLTDSRVGDDSGSDDSMPEEADREPSEARTGEIVPIGPDGLVATYDRNDDGAIGRDEVNRSLWEILSRVDQNGDQLVNADEIVEANLQLTIDRRKGP